MTTSINSEYRLFQQPSYQITASQHSSKQTLESKGSLRARSDCNCLKSPLMWRQQVRDRLFCLLLTSGISKNYQNACTRWGIFCHTLQYEKQLHREPLNIQTHAEIFVDLVWFLAIFAIQAIAKMAENEDERWDETFRMGLHSYRFSIKLLFIPLDVAKETTCSCNLNVYECVNCL